MGEIPHSEKMFHLPIEVSVYVPSTQDVDKVVSKSEMKLRVEEVKKYLATLFGGFSSSSVEGGFLASDGKVVKENVERVVSFAEKTEFDKNKEALVQKASEWAAKWGQEAIGLEHEGDLYYVPQKFENGGTIAIREAKEMANSQAIELKHHISELANVLKKNPTIEAWVIAKLERASSDLSDVTHYLDGRVQMSGKKMATGGNLPEKMIKVKVVYLEQQYFELTKEMEIPFSVYKEYDKTGKLPIDIQQELCNETTVEHWVETNPMITILTPITEDKGATEGGVQVLKSLFNKPEDITPIKFNGKTVGGIDVTTYRGDTETLRVHMMLILPEFQGKGIGAKAINKLFRDNPNVKQIIGNATAESKSFWQKIGAEFHSNEHTAFTITRKPDMRFKDGGNMEFERPSYQSNYVAGQAQANEIADENWNMDYENDPLIKAQKKAKETATRIGMAVATRGASEVSRQASEGGDEMSGANKMDMASMLKGMKG